MKPVAFALCAVLILDAGAALAWRAVNRNEVFAIGNGRFEVLRRPGTGPAQYWCAAGDFARRVVNTAGTQRIYVHRAAGPSVTRRGATAVQFALIPPPGVDAPQGYSLSVKPGANLSSAFAHQYCLGEDPFDRFPIRR